MRLSDGVPSSPPGPGASLEESLRYYKSQYELLESELAEFQASSKDLEAELEKDIENAEKRERHLKDKAANLQHDVNEWQAKHKQAKADANAAQNALQKEITALRDANRTLQLRLRDTEVANDDIERQQRNTESSLEDLEQKYNQTIERGIMLEEEMKAGEQERQALRIEVQRLRDEFADLKVEAEITKEKLRKAEAQLDRRRKALTLNSMTSMESPRSELSPTNTSASSPTMDTPPPKTASTSAASDTPTPPSPPISEKSSVVPKPFLTPSIPKKRMSINSNATPRQSLYSAKPTGHVRGPSTTISTRTAAAPSFRQSMSRPGVPSTRPGGVPPSTSMMKLQDLRGRMAKLGERVHTAKSRLPAPTDTPPQSSPRSGSAMGHNIPASVTVRSNRKRTGGSTVSGVDSLPDHRPETPSVRSKTSRVSLTQQPPTPTPGDMAAPPIRPSSRASMASRSSYVPGHSRPGSRQSTSNLRAPLGSGRGLTPAPNASTDQIRSKSNLSNYGHDGTVDEENDDHDVIHDYATPTNRRSTIGKRTSDVGSAIPSPIKRLSFGPASKLPAPAGARRQSSGLATTIASVGEKRSPSRQGMGELKDVQESYDVTETF